jgi:hypothetical protein
MLTRYKLIFSLAVVVTTASASADSLVYVVTASQQFGTVDLANGAFTAIGSGLPEGSAGLVLGPGGLLLTLTFSGNLDAINPATGVASVVGSTGLGGNGDTIGEVGGTVYATDFNNNVYKVNTSTGVATQISPATGSGIPADPTCGSSTLCDETLIGIGGKLYATWDSFTPNFTPTYSETIDSGPELYQIDPTTGVATPLSPTQLHIIAATDVGGTIYGFQGFPSAANPLPDPPIELVTLDLSNGTTSKVSDLPSSVGAIYAVAPDVPEPASLALVGTGLAALAARLRKRKISI